MVDFNKQPEDGERRDRQDSIDKPDSSDENKVIGVETNFPVKMWSEFPFTSDRRNPGKSSFLLGSSASSVPLHELREMRRRDAQVRSLLRLFYMPILSCMREGKWVKAPWVEDGDAEVDFANAMFRTPPQAGGMTTPISLVLKQHLLALVEGFAAFEEVRHCPKYGPLKGKWVLSGIEYRDSRTVEIAVDRFGKLDGIKQTARFPDGSTLQAKIDKDKLLLFTVGGDENPYAGVSMFEAAYHHYQIKKQLYYFSGKAAEFAAIPARVATYPEKGMTPAKRHAFQTALAQFMHNTSIVMPEGYKVDAFQTNTGFDFVKLIDHHSHLQAKSVLLQFMDDDNRMAVIDNGGQDASADMFVQGLMAIMDDIAELWTNQLMPKYIDWNFGSGKYPIWKFGELTDSARSDIASLFTTMVASTTLNSTPELLRALEKALALRLGLDIDYKEIAKREEEAAKKARDLAKAEADALEAQEAAGNLQAEQEGKEASKSDPASLDGGSDVGVQSAPGFGESAPTNPAQAQNAAMSFDQYQDDLDNLIALAQELTAAMPTDEIDDFEDDFVDYSLYELEELDEDELEGDDE